MVRLFVGPIPSRALVSSAFACPLGSGTLTFFPTHPTSKENAMKLTVKGLLFLIALASTLALAQTPPIQHVIVVIQENRSPDNLFGSDAFAGTHQLPNAHLSTYGLCEPIGYPGDTQI